MHEPIRLPCIFGCRGEHDQISHYLECQILWSIINEVFEGYVHPLAIGRVNYLEPNASRVIVISAAFEIYHALKIGLRETVDHAIACKRFKEIYRVSHKLITAKFSESYGRLNGFTFLTHDIPHRSSPHFKSNSRVLDLLFAAPPNETHLRWIRINKFIS